MSQILLSQMEQIIARLEQEFQNLYHPSIFHMECSPGPEGKWLIRGKVLTQKQLYKVLSALASFPIISLIEVISQTSSSVWGNAPTGTPVYDSPYQKNWMSQILSWEGPFSILDYPQVEGYQLIRMKDGTVGWIQGQKVKIVKSNPHLWEYSAPRSIRPISPYQLELTLESSREWMHTPYLLGGRTKEGIDCSGLVQAIFRDNLALLLPRNSKEQRKQGIRISRKEKKPLDLVFAKGINQGYSHVGIVMEEDQVLHSSRAKGKVVVEKFSQFSQHYRILGFRRLVTYGSL